jgi:UDP:flavonoid glycosyltransferase YjiC (YdhE family)
MGTGGLVDFAAPNAVHPERESVPLGPEWALFDFLPMDTMLGHADLLVTNGGFNTVMRAHSVGVPFVVAGEGAHKAQFAARVAFADSGINLGTGQPTVPSVKEAVDTLLAGG